MWCLSCVVWGWDSFVVVGLGKTPMLIQPFEWMLCRKLPEVCAAEASLELRIP